jgi:acetyl esterase/lipase
MVFYQLRVWIEHLALRAACALWPCLRRMFFGRPPEIDGQVLAEEMQVLRRMAAMSREDSVSDGGTLSPAQARARVRHRAAVAAGPPPPMTQVEAISMSGPGFAEQIAARLYIGPTAPPPPRPLLVFFHGGGWTVGGLDTHDGPCRFLATHSGAAVLSVAYRLTPEHPFPAAVEDAVASFRWAVSQAAQLGIDPQRIAVGGDSAGGNLAAGVCLLTHGDTGQKPAMQVLLYPATDAVGSYASRATFATGFLLTKADMEWFERHYLPPGVDRADPTISVLRAASHSGLPPAYVTTAGFDPLRDEGEAYAKRLQEAGVSTTLKRHPGLIHGFANLTAISPVANGAMRELAQAIQTGL